jgi:hypothetical protein
MPLVEIDKSNAELSTKARLPRPRKEERRKSRILSHTKIGGAWYIENYVKD